MGIDLSERAVQNRKLIKNKFLRNSCKIAESKEKVLQDTESSQRTKERKLCEELINHVKN